MAIPLHNRIYNSEVQGKKDGSEVIVAGWLADIKLLGKLAFLKLRDRSGFLQIVATEDFKGFKKLSDITLESVIVLKGKVKPSKAKAGGKELQLEDFEVLSLADPHIPIDMTGKIETDLSKRLDWRYLDLRQPKELAIFKVRAEVTRAVREFLANNGFIEMHTPKIVGMGAEGGATLFTVPDYYGKKAYLAQSQQFYKQMMQIAGFERVFEIGPSFRAEKSHTIRHLTEFSHVDVEMSFIEDVDDVLKIGEGLLAHVLACVKKNCSNELKLLGVENDILKLPVPRVTYSDAIKMLQKAGSKIKDGEDIGMGDEKLLGEAVKNKFKTDAYFLEKFPWKLDVCKFYSMREGNVGKVADFEYKGQEIFTGAQREHRIEFLKKQIKEKGLREKDFEYYTEPFKYGVPPHGGFGLGLDRLVQLILNLPNIREAVLFPRDTERLTP